MRDEVSHLTEWIQGKSTDRGSEAMPSVHFSFCHRSSDVDSPKTATSGCASLVGVLIASIHGSKERSPTINKYVLRLRLVSRTERKDSTGQSHPDFHRKLMKNCVFATKVHIFTSFSKAHQHNSPAHSAHIQDFTCFGNQQRHFDFRSFKCARSW